MRNFQKQLVSDCFYAEQTAFSSGTSYGIQVSSSWFLHRREFIMDKWTPNVNDGKKNLL